MDVALLKILTSHSSLQKILVLDLFDSGVTASLFADSPYVTIISGAVAADGMDVDESASHNRTQASGAALPASRSSDLGCSSGQAWTQHVQQAVEQKLGDFKPDLMVLYVKEVIQPGQPGGPSGLGQRPSLMPKSYNWLGLWLSTRAMASSSGRLVILISKS